MSKSAVFVACDQELGRLDRFLSDALEGQGQVCFVTGEAGSGKTALVSEFSRQAQTQHPALIVAYGGCMSHAGIADPYLPFREILQQLTGEVEEEVAAGTVSEESAGRRRNLLALSGRALAEVGPDLVGLFLPGAGLVARLATFALDEIDWGKKIKRLVLRGQEQKSPEMSAIDPKRIFEQYANVLRRLSEVAPLVLILDDLHWTDAASAELLFYLGQRLQDCRILILGAYRPDEVAQEVSGERHPLQKPLNEFRRYRGELCIELGQKSQSERQRFVEAFLDTEPNRLDHAFRRAFFEHTEGHPLFAIELLRDMQERGNLTQDGAGRWVPGEAFDWADLPARVEGVIEERLGRLDTVLREALSVGSVEGELFTAEVVARIQNMEVRPLVRRLSRELERRHRLVRSQAVRRLNGQRLSPFRFSHNLFQVYLYRRLNTAERAYLHEEVGVELESLYGEQQHEIAVQLAHHFDQAGLEEKACRYLRLAGEQAAARFANVEALRFFSRALALLPEGDAPGRAEILLARETVFDLQGDRQSQRQDLELLRQLADQRQDDLLRARIALRAADLAKRTSDYDQACVEAQTAVLLAEKLNQGDIRARGYLQWGEVLLMQGNYEKARSHLAEAASLADETDLRSVRAETLRLLGLTHYDQGTLDLAKEYWEQALPLFREMGDRRGEANLLNHLGNVLFLSGVYPQAGAYYREALAIRREIGDRQGEAKVLTNLGNLAGIGGDWSAEIDYQEKALAIYRETEDRRGETASLNNLGTSYYHQGDYGKAGHYFQETLEIRQAIGDRAGESEALNNLSAVAQQRGDYAAAESYALEALQIAREIGSRPSEAVLCINLGDCRWVRGDFPGAFTWFFTSLKLYREIGSPRGEVSALQRLGVASDSLGAYDQAQTYLEQALALSDSLGGVRKHKVLLSLALLLNHLEDPAGALEHSQGALDICQEGGFRAEEGNAWMRQGEALAAMDAWDGAQDAYREALEIRRDMGHRYRQLETMAGLAQLSPTRGELSWAGELVLEILGELSPTMLEGTDEPLRIYLTCFQVLEAAGDPRAGPILELAHNLLMEWADKIDDPAARQVFLGEVRVNREIIAAYQRLKA